MKGKEICVISCKRLMGTALFYSGLGSQAKPFFAKKRTEGKGKRIKKREDKKEEKIITA